jgi:hypothetical protein
MILPGEWYPCSDGVSRPILRGEILTAGGERVAEPFLIDTGADVTVLSSDVCSFLKLQANGSTGKLGGVEGIVESAIFDVQVQFLRDDGGIATFHGSFHAFVRTHPMQMSVLGQDILQMFAVIVDRPGDRVYLLRGTHGYEIKRSS